MAMETKDKVIVGVGTALAAGVAAGLAALFSRKPASSTAQTKPSTLSGPKKRRKGCGGCGR